MKIEDIIELIQDKMADFDSNIDTSEGSVFYQTVLNPLLDRANQPTIYSDPAAYIRSVIHDYNDELDVSPGSSIDQLVIQPVSYMIETLREHLNWAIAAHDPSKAKDLTGEELDELGKTYFIERTLGTYSRIARARVYFYSPRPVVLTTDVELINSDGDIFVPETIGQSFSSADFTLAGSLYYIEFAVIATEVGPKSINEHTLKSVRGIPGAIKADNVTTQSSDTEIGDILGTDEVTKDDFVSTVLPQAISQRSTVTERYIRALMLSLASDYVDIAIASSGDAIMERDLVFAKDIYNPTSIPFSVESTYLGNLSNKQFHIGNMADVYLKPKALNAVTETVSNVGPQKYGVLMSAIDNNTSDTSSTIRSIKTPSGFQGRFAISVGHAAIFKGTDSNGNPITLCGYVVKTEYAAIYIWVENWAAVSPDPSKGYSNFVFYRNQPLYTKPESASGTDATFSPSLFSNYPLFANPILIFYDSSNSVGVANVTGVGVDSSSTLIDYSYSIEGESSFDSTAIESVFILPSLWDTSDCSMKAFFINPYRIKSIGDMTDDNGDHSFSPAQETIISNFLSNSTITNPPIYVPDCTTTNNDGSCYCTTLSIWPDVSNACYLTRKENESDNFSSKGIIKGLSINGIPLQQMTPLGFKWNDDGKYLILYGKAGAMVSGSSYMPVAFDIKVTGTESTLILEYSTDSGNKLEVETITTSASPTREDTNFFYELPVDFTPTNATKDNLVNAYFPIDFTTPNIVIPGFQLFPAYNRNTYFYNKNYSNSYEGETIILLSSKIYDVAEDGTTSGVDTIGSTLTVKIDTSPLLYLAQNMFDDESYRVITADILARIAEIGDIYTNVTASGNSDDLKNSLISYINGLTLNDSIDISDLIQITKSSRVKLPWYIYVLIHKFSGMKRVYVVGDSISNEVYTAYYTNKDNIEVSSA